MAKFTKEQADVFLEAVNCENELFNQLSDEVRNASATLKDNPDTEDILTTVAALDIVRTYLRDISSADEDKRAAGVAMLRKIANLPAE